MTQQQQQLNKKQAHLMNVLSLNEGRSSIREMYSLASGTFDCLEKLIWDVVKPLEQKGWIKVSCGNITQNAAWVNPEGDVHYPPVS